MRKRNKQTNRRQSDVGKMRKWKVVSGIHVNHLTLILKICIKIFTVFTLFLNIGKS